MEKIQTMLHVGLLGRDSYKFGKILSPSLILIKDKLMKTINVLYWVTKDSSSIYVA